MKFLSQEWQDEFKKRFNDTVPGDASIHGKMQQVITEAPGGDIRYYWVIDGGKLVEAAVGDLEDAEFTMTAGWDDTVAVQKGELDANALFMQGKMKVNGNMARLMALMPMTNSPEYRQVMEEITAITEF